MSILTWLRGVISKMIGKEDIKTVLGVTPVISDAMRSSIDVWEQMYKNESPWLSESVHSIGLAALISSEKARMATLELEVKVTGENDRAEFLKKSFSQVEKSIRKQLEYGIALGGLVIKPYVVMGPNNKYKIKFTYTKASDFYPLSFSADGELTSAAFIDRIITKDKVYSKVELHSLESNSVHIINKAFEAGYKPEQLRSSTSSILGTEISLTSIPEWKDIEANTILKNVDTLLFAYFRNPEANTIDLDSPLGASGFSRAVNLIKEADEQYSNLLWEFEGGQLAIDVDRTAFMPRKDSKGRDIDVLPKLQERLFRHNFDFGDDYAYNIFSPNLRDSSIINGMNNILMHIEDVCCLARGTISEVNVSEARTATELKILKQRAYAANADIQKELEDCFRQLFNIMDIYCDMYDIVPDGEYEVAYKWDDSILVDKDAERQIDIIDINNGLMSKVEYRMKWFGETEVQAEEAINRIMDESQAKIQMQQEAMVGQSVNSSLAGGDPKTTKQDELDARERSQESNEHTTTEEKKLKEK